VTSTADATIYRTSTGSAKHVIAAGFGTGLASYFALGSAQDYSAYQGITLWVHVTVKALAAGELSIRLCSDAAGVTTVDTLALPAITQTGQWIPVYIDKGSALGASIQSIALYGDTDNGAITVYLDNINTVKAAGNDALTLQSLIGKNTAGEYWWALRSINGTTLTLDSSPITAVGTAGRGYYGTTESVTTYKRETIKTALVAVNTNSVQAVQDSGTVGSLITFSGGWNRTDMSTQTLETWFDGQSGFGVGVHINAKDYLSLDKIYGVRYYRAFTFDNSFTTVGIVGAGNCNLGIQFFSNDNLTASEIHAWGSYNSGIENISGSVFDIGTMRAISCGAAAVQCGWSLGSGANSGHWDIDSLELSNNSWHGINLPASSIPGLVRIGTLTVKDNGQAGVAFGIGAAMVGWFTGAIVASGNGTVGVNLSYMVGDWVIDSITATNNGTFGLAIADQYNPSNVVVGSLTTSGNGTASVIYSLLSGTYTIRKSSLAEATKLSGTSAGFSYGRLSFHNYNGTAGDHRTYVVGGGDGNGLGTILSESSVRHTASGLAWKLSPRTTTYISSLYPIVLPVAKLALAASVTKTISVWLRRTNTGLTGTLMVRGGQVDGIATDQTASITAVADTWEKVSVSVTPSVAGVIEVEVLAYGGTTYSLYVDDMEVA
jgi:hypothetical protein